MKPQSLPYYVCVMQEPSNKPCGPTSLVDGL
jgi:hypothetical protein